MGEKLDFKVPLGTPCLHAGCAAPAEMRAWAWYSIDEQEEPPQGRAVYFACMKHLGEIPDAAAA